MLRLTLQPISHLSTMSTNKTRKRLLPSLDELESEAKRHKVSSKNVNESFKSLSEVDLFSLPSAKLGNITVIIS